MLIQKANGFPTPHPPSMDFELELTQPLQTVAFRQRLVVAGGVFFLVDLGPGAAVGGMRLEKNIRYNCYLTAACRRRGVFFLVDLGRGAAVGGMRIEINTRYSCYLICNNAWNKMALQSITELDSHSSFYNILVFVCLCLCLSPCICHCICLFYFYYNFHDILPKFAMASTHSDKVHCFRRWNKLRVREGGGKVALSISDSVRGKLFHS